MSSGIVLAILFIIMALVCAIAVAVISYRERTRYGESGSGVRLIDDDKGPLWHSSSRSSRSGRTSGSGVRQISKLDGSPVGHDDDDEDEEEEEEAEEEEEEYEAPTKTYSSPSRSYSSGQDTCAFCHGSAESGKTVTCPCGAQLHVKCIMESPWAVGCPSCGHDRDTVFGHSDLLSRGFTWNSDRTVANGSLFWSGIPGNESVDIKIKKISRDEYHFFLVNPSQELVDAITKSTHKLCLNLHTPGTWYFHHKGTPDPEQLVSDFISYVKAI